jgi:site-specific recombinase XerD
VRVPFKDAADRAGLPKALRVHDLRHTFASLFLVDGGDIFKLSRILGHSSVKITADTYAHLKPTAYVEDYGRVRFAMPSDAPVLKLSAT